MIKRGIKIYYIAIILLLLLSFAFGYAILNSDLIINGTSKIQENTWDVHFENIQVASGSVTTSASPTISDNTTISSVNLPLEKTGDFYEFTVDVVNNGTIDAMIDNITEKSELTDSQKKYLSYTVEYKNGEQIAAKQLLKSTEFARLKVRVEYKKNISASDLPTSNETLNLVFTVNYIQADDSAVSVFGNGLIKIVSGDGTNVGDEICLDDECFYVLYSDDDTITMLSKINITTDTIPIQNSSASKVVFSSTNYWSSKVSSYPAYVYNSNSKVYTNVESYKMYLESQGTKIEEARLIKMEELETFGCKRSGTSGSCTAAPSWIFETSYWTGAAGSSTSVWFLNSGGALRQSGSSYGRTSGVRPVIIILKSLIS